MATKKVSTKLPKKLPVGGAIKTIGSLTTAKIDPRKEYLAGGFLSSYQSQALSSRIDDINPRDYEDMLNDPEVSKCINVLKISTLGDGVSLIPAVSEKDPDYEQAYEICDFCNSAIMGLEKPLRDTLEQMMDALAFGHKIAEITYKTGTLKGYEGEKLLLDRIKVKPRNSVRFVVDNRFNILGFVGKLASNQGLAQTLSSSEPLTLTSGQVTPIINGMPLLPKEKFMVLTIRAKDEDPRGQSMLRPAFNAWTLKNLVWPEYLRYLLVCAIPLLVGTTAPEEGQAADFQRDLTGNPITDSEGRYIQVNPVEALRDALTQARNATTVALKAGSVVKEVGGQGAGTPFYKAIDTFDSQIETGILLQTLATSEGTHQSRAASQTHMTVLDSLVYWLKGVIIDMLISDLLKPLVRFNFGDDALDLVPLISLGDTERREFATDAAAVGSLFSVGYLQPDQLPETDLMLGLVPRESVDPSHLVQQLQDAGVPIQAVPPDPTHVATIQAGPSGGQSPIPIAARTGLPKGRSDSAQQLPSKERTSRTGVARFPAIGRLKNAINKSPKNSKLAGSK